MKKTVLSAMVAISLFSGCDESNGGADNNASIVKKDPISKVNSKSIYTGKGDDIESKAYYINSAGNKVDNPYYIPEKGKKGVTVGGNFGNRISVDLSDIENKFVIKTYFYDNNTEIHPDIDPGDVGAVVCVWIYRKSAIKRNKSLWRGVS